VNNIPPVLIAPLLAFVSSLAAIACLIDQDPDEFSRYACDFSGAASDLFRSGCFDPANAFAFWFGFFIVLVPLFYLLHGAVRLAKLVKPVEKPD
jgi:hypothetical protein